MKAEGPPLESLTHRLTEIPQEFLAEPRIGTTGIVHVDAIVHDVLRSMGLVPGAAELANFVASDIPRHRNRLAVTLLFCWLLADESFRGLATQMPQVMGLLHADAMQLAAQIASSKIIADPDRREELARLALARLGYRPQGETEAQAQDRLASVSSLERTRVIQAARDAEARARAVREALVRKAAQESADKFTRE